MFAFDEDLRSIGGTEEKPSHAGEPAEGEAPPPADPVAALGKAIREAKATGTRTDIGAALRGVAREFLQRDDRRLAGVLLFSDGRDNAQGETPVAALAGLGRGAEDLRVQAVAQLGHTGFDGATGVVVRLEIDQVAGPDGKPFDRPRRHDPPREDADRATGTVALLPAPRPTPVSLRAPFREAGTYDVRVRAVLPPALAREDAIVEDDVKVHRLRVVDQTIRVLLVDSEMRYETHFLKNVLVRESRHPGDPRRVDAQVWVQSFDRDVRQPHGRAVPTLRAFPSTRQELFAYDVIVIGDVNWRTLADTEERSAQVLRLLKDFVAEGGGVAFVAGENANPTAFADTPLQDLLPVIARPSDRANQPPSTTPFRLTPTEAGREHPILSVMQDRPEKVEQIWREREGWDWYWLYRARGGLKPGAFALARVFGTSTPDFQDERGEPLVVFAAMGYGKGRVFFSAIDQISRIRRNVADTYYGPFWDEAIRWLATQRLLGGNKRYKIETDKESYFVGETAVVKVSALDADYQPLRDSVLRGLQVEDPEGRPLLTDADAARPDPESGPGVYRTAVRLGSSGTYRVYVDPPQRDGGARAEKRIEARFATTEDQDKVPDHETLRAVVKATNPAGAPVRVWAPWQLDELAASIPARTTERILARDEVELWDGPWALLLATAVLALEWILRKRFQMI